MPPPNLRENTQAAEVEQLGPDGVGALRAVRATPEGETSADALDRIKRGEIAEMPEVELTEEMIADMEKRRAESLAMVARYEADQARQSEAVPEEHRVILERDDSDTESEKIEE